MLLIKCHFNAIPENKLWLWLIDSRRMRNVWDVMVSQKDSSLMSLAMRWADRPKGYEQVHEAGPLDRHHSQVLFLGLCIIISLGRIIAFVDRGLSRSLGHPFTRKKKHISCRAVQRNAARHITRSQPCPHRSNEIANFHWRRFPPRDRYSKYPYSDHAFWTSHAQTSKPVVLIVTYLHNQGCRCSDGSQRKGIRFVVTHINRDKTGTVFPMVGNHEARSG